MFDRDACKMRRQGKRGSCVNPSGPPRSRCRGSALRLSDTRNATANGRVCESNPTMTGIILLYLLAQSTWYVDAASVPPGDGSPSNPYASIGYAVAQPTTMSGDTVLVAPGNYVDEIIDFQGKNLSLQGTGGPSVTNVRANQTPSSIGNSILRCTSGEDSSANVVGLTFWGYRGMNSGVGGSALIIDSSPTFTNVIFRYEVLFADRGGALYLERSSTSIIDCQFIGCRAASNGGAIFAWDSNFTIDGAVFQGCQADSSGGAIYSCNSVMSLTDSSLRHCGSTYGNGGALYIACTAGASFVRRCQFDQNGGGSLTGGAINSSSFLSIEECVFDGNVASDDGLGGAVASFGPAIVTHSVFARNYAARGGAIYAWNHILISDSHFTENQVSSYGISANGAGVDAWNGNGEVIRSTFYANALYDGLGGLGGGGSAIYGATTLTVDACTIVDNIGNIGGAIRSVGAVRNSIVRGNVPSQVEYVGMVNYTNVQGGASGIGNIDANPSFHGPEDFHLMPDSPCIDAGDPQSPIDPDGTIADVGALFFEPTYCGANCTGSLGSPACIANLNSTGRAAQLTAIGSAEVPLDHLVLLIRDTPVSSVGFILASQLPSNISLGGGSQGVLCLGSPVLRFSNTVLNDRGTGVVSFRPRLSQFPQGASVQAGETWYFQYWYRDVNPVLTSNTSNAHRIIFL